MKNAKKIILVAISIAMISFLFVGCGAGEGNDNSSVTEPTVSPTTRTLNVHVENVAINLSGTVVICKDITKSHNTEDTEQFSKRSELPDPQTTTDSNGDCVFDGLFIDHTYYLFAQGVGSKAVTISENDNNFCTITKSATIVIKTETADLHEGIMNVLVDFGCGIQDVSNPYGFTYFLEMPAGTYPVSATPQFGGYVPQNASITANDGEVTEIVIVMPSTSP